jgi:hypothetical protein
LSASTAATQTSAAAPEGKGARQSGSRPTASRAIDPCQRRETVFEDQTIELLPARTTMRAMGRWARAPHITLNITFITVEQVSFGNNSPNTSVIILSGR